jgi:hypothetical protein
MGTTFNKAIATFLTALAGLVAAFGFDSEVGKWATPSNIELASSVLGALASAAITYWVPNKPKA